MKLKELARMFEPSVPNGEPIQSIVLNVILQARYNPTTNKFYVDQNTIFDVLEGEGTYAFLARVTVRIDSDGTLRYHVTPREQFTDEMFELISQGT